MTKHSRMTGVTLFTHLAQAIKHNEYCLVLRYTRRQLIFRHRMARVTIEVISDRRDPVGIHIGRDGKLKRTYLRNRSQLWQWLAMVDRQELSRGIINDVWQMNRDERLRRHGYDDRRLTAVIEGISERLTIGKRVQYALWKRFHSLAYLVHGAG